MPTHEAQRESSLRSGDRTLPLIVQLLEETARWDSSALDAVWEAQSRDKVTVEEALLRANLASERQIVQAYADHYLTPLFDPDIESGEPQLELAAILPAKLCREHWIVPMAANEWVVEIAIFSPDALLLVDELQLLTAREVRLFFAPLSSIERWISVLFEEGGWTPANASSSADFQEVEDEKDEAREEPDDEEVVHLDQPPPPGRDGRIIRYVNQVFEQALTRGASDIHIEPFETSCRVRLRIDGGLTEMAAPPTSIFNAIVARIKVLAKMDIAEKRVPQDGAIALRTGARRVDMRVNTCPTVHGEKVVLRVLDKDAIPLRLTNLGMDERQERDLIAAIQMPHGLMLVTGPTGSGKSTTLYSCLNCLNQPDVNICTAEDPVEYKFPGINQVQTRSQVGLTFASTLRSFLRQDPDVIMVGEVRDGETAEICLRAALTGHFVLSTLHTNDALAAVTRLGEMGIEPFLLASTLRVVVAQRLIRRLCPLCKEPQELDEETARRVGVPPGHTIYRPVGCGKCRDTGYKGRVGAFEVIRITQKLGQLIQRRATLDELRQEAVSQGMKLLSDSAMSQVLAGLTSLEEALSITVSEE